MSGRRFRPQPLSEIPFGLDAHEYLQVRGIDPKPWAETFGALFEKIYLRATKTTGIVDFTTDQINASRAISRIVLDYAIELATWVERKGKEPDMKPVAKILASFLRQARDFELQYDYTGKSLVDHVRYLCTSYYAQLGFLQRYADKARKLVSPSKKCVVKFKVSMEMELPVLAENAKQYLEEHGSKLLFSAEEPGRITTLKVTEVPEPPAPKKVRRKVKPKKKRIVKRRKT